MRRTGDRVSCEPSPASLFNLLLDKCGSVSSRSALDGSIGKNKLLLQLLRVLSAVVMFTGPYRFE